MNFLNLLATEITTYGGGFGSVNLNWLTKVIKFIIETPYYSVAVGIIFFTIALKLITLPFDIFSRASMKKNSLTMERMRPELEKMQKQYANNKELYNKKMMALYKKEGYSTCSSCLPTLLSLVFFFVVISGFNTYSRYANKETFNKMAVAYTQSIDEMDSSYVTKVEEEGKTKYYLNTQDGSKFSVYLQNNYTFIQKSGEEYLVTDVKSLYDLLTGSQRYSDNVLLTANSFTEDGTAFNEELFKTEVSEGIFQELTQEEINKKITTVVVLDYLTTDFLDTEVYPVAREASAKTFRKSVDKFMITGTKNIWVADVSYKHPVSWSDFKEAMGNDKSVTADAYNELTAHLSKEKSQPNGFFVLVILSIAVMILSQIVMNKTQKSQMELQTVDGANGQAAQTQKMMMWMMPVMFGIFAFIYTASFSIYMIVSSLLSTLSTVLINYFVELKFKKDMQKLEEERLRKRYGRGISEKKNKEKK